MASGRTGGVIKPIDRGAVHRICSGQVVLDLATAVKELVENSLDAGASSVEIRLKDYGMELIEVADNGAGVAPENYQGLTLKYHTSKISEFADLQTLCSFGFRGEALSSLCALANMSIVTRTKDEPIASRLVYDHSGVLISQERVARAVGTTVAVAKLFSPLPVRFKEFSRNIRREYSRLLSILQAYALIAKGVKLLCSNQTGRAGRTTVVQTQCNSTMKDNIVTVFGTKTAACMEQLDLAVSDGIRVEGFVSKPGAGCGRASGDRQFFYINGRPVDMPKVAKLLNELYRSFNSLQYPMLVLNFILPTTAYDVNVTPDKRKVFIHAEGALMVSLREALEKVYAPNKYQYTLNKLDGGSVFEKGELSVKKTSGQAGSNAESDREDASDGEEYEENSEDFVNKPREVGQTGTGLPGRFSMDLLSFERKSTSGLSSKTSNTKIVQKPVSSNKVLADKQSVKNVQPTLTACISKRKRSVEEAGGGLLSEEPLLKRWAMGNPANKPSSDTCSESVQPSLHHSEVEVGDAGGHDSLGTTIGSECATSVSESGPCPINGMASCGPVPGSDGEMQTQLMKLPSFSLSEPVLHNLTSEKCRDDIEGLSSRLKCTVDDESGAGAKLSERVTEPPELGLASQSRKTRPLEATTIKGIFDPTGKMMMPCTKSRGKDFLETSNVEGTKGQTQPSSELGRSNTFSGASEFADEPCDTSGKGDKARASSTLFSSRATTADGHKTTAGHEDEMNPVIENPTVQFDIQKLRKNFRRGLLLRQMNENMNRRVRSSKRASCFTAATLLRSDIQSEGIEKEAALAAATKELDRSFNKADFKQMQVLGQFNLGFILAKINQDIFIVDQHASDEKYNFERLTKTTVLNRQPLLRPLPLELSAADEITVTTHLETFRKNGFDFVEAEDAPAGQRLRLSAVPFSKNMTFGVGDVQELISLLADEPVMSFSSANEQCEELSNHSCHVRRPGHSSWLPRPSRVRGMFASRACRSSIMIGDPLSKKEMERIVSHLAELDSPWNCPHGRPTMRHLVDMSSIGKQYPPSSSRP